MKYQPKILKNCKSAISKSKKKIIVIILILMSIKIQTNLLITQ